MSIKLHPKYGLNPTMTTCFICGDAKDILLVGNASKKEMPHKIGCIDKKPCQKCKEYMTQGVICISVKDGESGDNPYRTGGWCVVKTEFIERVINDIQLLNDILKKRVLFLHDTVWDAIGLPRTKE